MKKEEVAKKMSKKIRIPLGKGRRLNIDKTGLMYQTNHEGGRNRYFTRNDGKFSYASGAKNPKKE